MKRVGERGIRDLIDANPSAQQTRLKAGIAPKRRRSDMDVTGMYEEFRSLHPELTNAADIRHIEIWDSVSDETAFLWFESLAATLNVKMGHADERAKISLAFMYFDKKFRTGNMEIKRCINVSFVENLFWQVPPRNAAPVWATLPKSLQQLYVDFHGEPAGAR
jgi:hypothetical protein